MKWDAVENAQLYNIYKVDNYNNVELLKTTTNTEAFIAYASTEIAVSAIINNKETYLSKLTKPDNLWWTNVTSTKLDEGYKIEWDTIPVAEDYVLISSFKTESGMSFSIDSDACEYCTYDLEEYHRKLRVTSSNTKISKKCKSLNTTDNNAIFDASYFDGSYFEYIHLFAKIEDSYYCISDKISFE